MTELGFELAGWAKLSVFAQMGNIGSEVGRTMNAITQDKPKRAQSAFYRALDLIDVTAELWASQKKPGLRELLIARELLASAFLVGEPDHALEEYFMQFGRVARRAR